MRLMLSLSLGAALFTQGATAEEVFSQARWIAPPAGVATNFATPIFRKEFVLSRQPVHGWLRIVGLGDFDARVNGRRVAGTGMNQPWSQYEKTIYYREFDISGCCRTGLTAWG
jgi:alpha-L-rhamnosidase